MPEVECVMLGFEEVVPTFLADTFAVKVDQIAVGANVAEVDDVTLDVAVETVVVAVGVVDLMVVGTVVLSVALITCTISRHDRFISFRIRPTNFYPMLLKTHLIFSFWFGLSNYAAWN